jgi:hypothetical protein
MARAKPKTILALFAAVLPALHLMSIHFDELRFGFTHRRML